MIIIEYFRKNGEKALPLPDDIREKADGSTADWSDIKIFDEAIAWAVDEIKHTLDQMVTIK